MTGSSWILFGATFFALVARKEIHGDGNENVSDTIRSLQEQVNALLDHRQQDYNALEGSLKHTIEKNTELSDLKNEMRQLRKEVVALRGGNGNGNGNGNGSGSGNGNEAKNERLRVRWLGSAVTELQGEVAQVLRTRNASEELAERSRMKSEFALLKGDVTAVGRGIRNLGGRIAKIDAILGTIRLDIASVKESFSLLSRTCADIGSQLSSVQIEVKSLRCDSAPGPAGSWPIRQEGGVEGGVEGGEKLEANVAMVAASSSGAAERNKSGQKGMLGTGHRLDRRRYARRHGYWRRSEVYRGRHDLENRVKNLDRRVSLIVQDRASLEKRIAAQEGHEWSSLSWRVKSLEKARLALSRGMSNVSESAATLIRNVDSRLECLEDAVERNGTSTKRDVAQLSVDAARKAAELSLTREELNNLRRTVQALSVSASKLQERSDRQEEAIDLLQRLNGSSLPVAFPPSQSPQSPITAFTSLQLLEDQYHLIRSDAIGDCREGALGRPLPNGSADRLRLLEVGEGARPLLVHCRGEWTVVARRFDGTVDFDRTWHDYSLGFGSPVREYWIGNELLHRLTRDNCSKLRIDMLDIYGERWRAEYQSFAVDSEKSGYRLRVYGYSGNATDALSYQNGMSFSAKDRDMDVSVTHCARNYHGGWWFSRCQHANLNGKYSLGLTWYRSDTNRWMSIASSEMSIRRNTNCPSR